KAASATGPPLDGDILMTHRKPLGRKSISSRSISYRPHVEELELRNLQSFNTSYCYPTGGAGPEGVVVEDFNGDGTADVATPNTSSGTVTALLGKGDGTFPTGKISGAGFAPVSLAAADFNEDTILDLAVANDDPVNGSVSTLLGNGDGFFQAAASYP